MNEFSFKELEHCYLKATYSIEIGNKTISPKEVIAHFDKIQVAGLEELKQYTTANGGFDNRPHVFWETTKELDLNFSQGVFSKSQFALMVNSKLFEIQEGEQVLLTDTISGETDEDGNFGLEVEPVDLFVYDETGEKITDFSLEGKTLKIGEPYKNLLINFTYPYSNGAKVVKIGNRLYNGFVELEGRTRVKDDTTGQVVSGIIKIPKLKLMTNLSMRLGAQATPVVGSFKGVGVPVGSRGNSHVCEFYFLNNCIDSDM